MENQFEEYVTFHITARDGSDVEMAVVDEFDFEKKHYVVGAVVKDDVIDEVTNTQKSLVKSVNQNLPDSSGNVEIETSNLPTISTDDAGKFLRVSSTGEWVAESIANASGVSF